MNHLEQLLYEYYDWQGYLVKRNIKVGRLLRGGWEGELDIIAYHPIKNHLVHIESSIDADAWAVREIRFKRKFDCGKDYIFSEIFTWLDNTTPIEQIAVLISHPKNRNTIGDGKIISIDELIKDMRIMISSNGVMSKKAIPEQYSLLRTIQLVTEGYIKRLA